MKDDDISCAICGRQRKRDYTDVKNAKLDQPWTCSVACRERMRHLLSARQAQAARAQWAGVSAAERKRKMVALARRKWAQIKARKALACGVTQLVADAK